MTKLRTDEEYYLESRRYPKRTSTSHLRVIYVSSTSHLRYHFESSNVYFADLGAKSAISAPVAVFLRKKQYLCTHVHTLCH